MVGPEAVFQGAIRICRAKFVAALRIVSSWACSSRGLLRTLPKEKVSDGHSVELKDNLLESLKEDFLQVAQYLSRIYQELNHHLLEPHSFGPFAGNQM
jgi:hypothetical protein